MDNFKIIYRILKHLEEHMGEENLDIERISHGRLGISRSTWDNRVSEV